MSRLFSFFFEKPPMVCAPDHPPSPPLRRDKSIPATTAVAPFGVSWTISIRMQDVADFQIRPARVEDVPVILQLIRDLATYERAPDEVRGTEEQLGDVLFGKRRAES